MKFNYINRQTAFFRTILVLMLKNEHSNNSEVELYSFDCMFLSLTTCINLFPGQGEFLWVGKKNSAIHSVPEYLVFIRHKGFVSQVT